MSAIGGGSGEIHNFGSDASKSASDDFNSLTDISKRDDLIQSKFRGKDIVWFEKTEQIIMDKMSEKEGFQRMAIERLLHKVQNVHTQLIQELQEQNSNVPQTLGNTGFERLQDTSHPRPTLKDQPEITTKKGIDRQNSISDYQHSLSSELPTSKPQRSSLFKQQIKGQNPSPDPERPPSTPRRASLFKQAIEGRNSGSYDGTASTADLDSPKQKIPRKRPKAAKDYGDRDPLRARRVTGSWPFRPSLTPTPNPRKPTPKPSDDI